MEMQNLETGVKTFKQIIRGVESVAKCPTGGSCCKVGIDGAFTPTAIVEWIMDKLSLESHLGK